VEGGEPLPLTDGVRAMIGQRLSLLSEDAQRALRVAAVIGSELDASLLRESLARLSHAEVDAALEALCRNDVLLASGGRLRFAHDLIRDTALTSTSKISPPSSVGLPRPAMRARCWMHAPRSASTCSATSRPVPSARIDLRRRPWSSS
jgi:hypothetical protein